MDLRRAFSLIELLVVITLVVLLLALLLPALRQARAAVRDVQCMTHQRSLAAAGLLYSTDWMGYLPFYHTWEEDGNGSGFRGFWAGRVFRYVNEAKPAYRCPAYVCLPERHIGSGLDWTHVQVRTADQGEVGQPGLELYIDYGTFYGGVSYTNESWTPSPALHYPRFGKLQEQTGVSGKAWGLREASYPLFSEPRSITFLGFIGSPRGFYEGFSGASSWNISWAYWFTTLHKGGCNVPYADGHVQQMSFERVFESLAF